MEVRLDQIVEEPFRWHESRAVPPASLERPDLLELGEVDWRGSITPTTSGYLFAAHLAYEQTVACPRCLEPATSWVDTRVELLIVRPATVPTVGEHRLEGSDLSTLLLEDEVLDTEPILIEQLQLNLPMRSLCREECAGLCPVCGANRNHESCDCVSDGTDPRWAALAALRPSAKPSTSGDS